MKKILSVILILTVILSAVSCSDAKYEPIPSTEEESRVLMAFNFEGEEYELKYELYRALFLNHSRNYDGGDASFWSTDAANKAKEEINKKIVDLALDIFSVLHLSKKIGYDPYSNDAEEKINEYIVQSVDGSETVVGFGGDYDAYLKYLRDMNLNYSVQVLLYRYSIAYDKVIEYYRGSASADAPNPDMQDGALEYKKSDVENFYNGNDSVRISIIVFSEYMTLDKVKERRDAIVSKSGVEEALNYAVSFAADTSEDASSDILDGVVIGKNSMDSNYYSEVIDQAFSLEIGEFSPVISVSTAKSTEYWVICKREKTSGYLSDNFDDIKDAYVSDRIGEIIANAKDAIGKTASKTDAFINLDYSNIKMS